MDTFKQRIAILFDTDKKKYIALAVLVGMAIVMLIALAFGLRSKSPDTKENGLKASTVKIGDSPFIDACSVLTLQDIQANTNGELTPPSTYARDYYYDTSVPNNRYDTEAAYQSRCRYKPLDRTAKVVVVDIAHAKNTGDIKNLLAAIDPTVESIESDIKTLENKFANSGSSEAKTFIRKLRDDKDKVVEYVRTKEATVPIGSVIPSILTRDYGSGLNIDQQFSFFVVTKYALVKFSYVVDDSGTPFNNLNENDLAKGLVLASKNTQSIISHTKDNTLSEKPVDATLGTEQTPWGVKILEPCDVLSKSIFKEATGVEQNEPVIISTLPYKYDFKRQQEKRIGLPSNSCERSYRASNVSKSYNFTEAENAFGMSGRAVVELTISYGLDKSQVTAGLDLSAPGAVPITSDADELRRIDSNSFTFSKSNYVYRLDISGVKSAAGNPSAEIDISDDQIRALVASIL